MPQEFVRTALTNCCRHFAAQASIEIAIDDCAPRPLVKHERDQCQCHSAKCVIPHQRLKKPYAQHTHHASDKRKLPELSTTIVKCRSRKYLGAGGNKIHKRTDDPKCHTQVQRQDDQIRGASHIKSDLLVPLQLCTMPSLQRNCRRPTRPESQAVMPMKNAV